VKRPGISAMQVSITLPDDIAHHLEQHWGNLQKAVLEMVTAEAYKSEAITRAEVGRLLDLPSRFDVDAFLKRADAPLHYDEADVENDLKTIEQLRAEGFFRQP